MDYIVINGKKIEIDWNKITDNENIIKLIKKREEIDEKIRRIDSMALVKYQTELLKHNL